MNGVALVVALSALGVNYDVQTSEDNKLEYVVQMEPELLKSLAEGREIHSAVPPDVGDVQRVLIRVGTTAANHNATSIAAYKKLLITAPRYASSDTTRAGIDPTTSILWPAKSKPEINYYVKHGYQPDSEGVLSYYMQIDPTLLHALAIGDEIRASIDPAAGRVGRFVIRAGSDDLPRIPVEPVAAPLAGNDPLRDRFQPGSSAAVRSGADAYAGASPSAFSVRPTGARPGDGRPNTVAPLERSTVRPSTVSDYGQAAAAPVAVDASIYGPTQGGGSRSNTSSGEVSPGFGRATADQATAPVYGPEPAAYGDRRFEHPRASIEPPQGQYGPPAQNYVARTGGDQLPPTYQAPNYQTPAPQGQANFAPAPQDRVASLNRPAAAAGSVPPLAAPQINTTSSNRSATESALGEKPWLPLMFTCFALFLSIGGNLYLGWTAGEYYSRYRLATERLRSAGRS